jgi:hypothetical protein
MLQAQDKQRILQSLEEVKQAVENDQAGICVIMCNFVATWSGSMFELLGWFNYIADVMKMQLLAGSGPKKSRIVVPEPKMTQ